MKRIIGILTVLWLMASTAGAQERRLQYRPYLDQRKFHYGFSIGVHSQGIDLENKGFIDPETGQQWFATNDRTEMGFTVGVLGEWRLNTYFSLRVVPSMHFGQKHIAFREQATGQEDTQDMKSTFVSVPVNIKFSSPRFNNYRPYLVAGLNPMYDLTTKKQDFVLTKPLQLYAEVGLGCDFYLPFFKLIPELKFCFGLTDVLERDRSSLIDQSKLVFTRSLNRATPHMVILSLYFE